MVKIRLTRAGRRNLPVFHLVAADSRAARDGRVLERLGLYEKRPDQSETIVVDLERVSYWLGVGAQLTDAAEGLLDKYMRFRPEEKAT
jgi:small subunit ribosomal protein S16